MAKIGPMGLLGGSIGTVGGPLGAITGYKALNGLDQPMQGPGVPVLDPNLKKLQESRVNQANQFRANMPSVAEQKQQLAYDLARDDINKGSKDIKRGFNKRGALYSGLRAGAESDMMSQAASNLAQTRAGINTELEDQASGMEAQSIQSGLALQSQQQLLNNLAYQQALDNYAQRKQGLQSLFGAAGSVTGGMLGNS